MKIFKIPKIIFKRRGLSLTEKKYKSRVGILNIFTFLYIIFTLSNALNALSMGKYILAIIHFSLFILSVIFTWIFNFKILEIETLKEKLGIEEPPLIEMYSESIHKYINLVHEAAEGRYELSGYDLHVIHAALNQMQEPNTDETNL